MQVSSLGMRTIMAEESFRAVAYQVNKKEILHDIWSIGWGHTRTAKKNMRITREKGAELLRLDLAEASSIVNRRVNVPLNQNQFDALCCFVFSVGETQFISSTLLRKLNAADYTGAANEFPRWIYSGDEIMKGLIRRRSIEKKLFETGVLNA